MKLGIIEYIDAAHYLPGHKTCGTMHGHTFKIEVKITGSKKENGMIIDFIEIKSTLKDILKDYDHTVLNETLKNPTCENLCESIYSKLEKKLEFPFTLRIWEGRDKWVEK